MTKQEVRKKYKKMRQQLSEKELDDYSLEIANNVLKLPIWDNTYFHTFLPIANQKEVNTEYLLNILSGKDKEVVIPRSNFSDLSMTSILLTDNTIIKPNNYGIPEPTNGLEVPVDQIEVVFVPLLAFNSTGDRIGYGKGFYDRFLASCNPNIVKVGLSFFEEEKMFYSDNQKDIPLTYCVTPKQIYIYN